MRQLVGTAVKRREDPRLITGQGNFVDDIKLTGMLYATVLRSPYAHASIKNIDVTKALAHSKVVAVYTGRDLLGKVKTIPTSWVVPGCNIKPKDRPLLAHDKVRYTGEGVAFVVAEDRYAARDALELIEVEYEELPAVFHQEAGMAEGAPLVHDDVEKNLAFHWVAGEVADEAFTQAEVAIKERFYVQRVVPNPMETRGAVAQYNPGSGELTLWCTSQNPHIHRMVYSDVLGFRNRNCVSSPPMSAAVSGQKSPCTRKKRLRRMRPGI